LIAFTWNYFLRNPEFLALLNTENLARARHLKRSAKVKSMHSPFVEMIRTVVTRGVEKGDFPVAVDPVQLYISIARCAFSICRTRRRSASSSAGPTEEGGQGRAPRSHGGAGAGALTGKSAATFGKAGTEAAGAGAFQRGMKSR